MERTESASALSIEQIIYGLYQKTDININIT